jgi:hypothetical protein
MCGGLTRRPPQFTGVRRKREEARQEVTSICLIVERSRPEGITRSRLRTAITRDSPMTRRMLLASTSVVMLAGQSMGCRSASAPLASTPPEGPTPSRYVVTRDSQSLFTSPEAQSPRSREWDRIANRYIKDYREIEEPKPVAYPRMADRLRTLFHGRKFSHVQVFDLRNGHRELSADISYGAGELHILQKKGWNLVTQGAEAYEWETGEKEGLITKAKTEDLIDYLLYFTDPSYIMTSMFYNYLLAPETYHAPVKQKDGCIKLRAKELSHFSALYLFEKPLWFCGFEMKPSGSEGQEAILYSQPTPIPEVPQRVIELPDGMRFEKSSESIRRHMVYL